MSVIKGLDIVVAEIEEAECRDDLEECLTGVSNYLNEKQETHTDFLGLGNSGVSEEYSLSHQETEQVTKVIAQVLDKAAKLHIEANDYSDFFEDDSLIEDGIEAARRIGTVGKMVNFLGHSDNFPQAIEKSGPSTWVLFDHIEGTIANQTQLDFSGDTSGFMNIMDSYVTGLKQFAETGYTPSPKMPTYGIEKFGTMMRSDTIDTLGEIGARHSEVIKLRTMAAILEHFQPEGQDEDFSLAHDDFKVPNPNDYPEVNEYRRWLENDDLDAFLEEVYSETLNAGADFLHYAKEEDKEEMAKNYVFAAGFIEKCKEENILVVKQLESRNIRTNQHEVARFSGELPEGILYPQKEKEQLEYTPALPELDNE